MPVHALADMFTSQAMFHVCAAEVQREVVRVGPFDAILRLVRVHEQGTLAIAAMTMLCSLYVPADHHDGTIRSECIMLCFMY